MDINQVFDHVKRGDLDAVKALLDVDGSCVDLRDEVGATPLHYAALHGFREIARVLIQSGADVNCRDERFGATPAGWSIEYLRESGGLLSIEIDDMSHAIESNDAGWVTRLMDRFPFLRDASDDAGVPLKELAAKSSNAEVRSVFAAASS